MEEDRGVRHGTINNPVGVRLQSIYGWDSNRQKSQVWYVSGRYLSYLNSRMLIDSPVPIEISESAIANLNLCE